MSDALNYTKETRYAGVIHRLSAAEEQNLDERGIPKKLGRLYRKLERVGYDAESRTVTVAASSSTPVERYFGQEILSHEKGAIRDTRLKNGVSLLFNHNYDALLGRSISYELGDPLRVTSRFGNSDLAKEKEQEVADEILVDVSIGYLVHEWEITEDKNGIRTYLAVDWEPYEISLVTVPADSTVGVGRDAKEVKVRSFKRMADDDDPDDDGDSEDDDPDDESERSKGDEEDPDSEDDEDEEDEGERSASPKATRTTQPNTERKLTMADANVEKDTAALRKERGAALRSIRKMNPEHYTEDALLRDLDSDESVSVIGERVADTVIKAKESGNVRTIGDELFGRMSDKERKSYSLRNVYCAAVNARAAGTFKDKGAEAGLEREVSDDLRKAANERGITGLGGGIIVPSATTRSLWNETQQRALAAGGNAGTATNVVNVDANPIELLRGRTVCLALGARMMSGLHGTVKLSRQTGAASSNWLAEAGSVTNSDPTLDAITMTPHRLSIFNSYYLELLAQSPLAVDSFLAMDRLNVLARSLDVAGLNGPGTSNVPLGLMNQSGLAAILTGTTRAANGTITAGAGGVPMSFVDVNNMEAAISTANGDIGTLGWAMRPKVRAAMRSTPQIPGTASGFIFPNSKPDARGIQEGPLGYNAIASTLVPTGYTVNSVPNLDAVILGVWDQMLFGDWGLSEVIADNITGAASGLFKIIEHAMYDTNVRHIESFAASTSVLPS